MEWKEVIFLISPFIAETKMPVCFVKLPRAHAVKCSEVQEDVLYLPAKQRVRN